MDIIWIIISVTKLTLNSVSLEELFKFKNIYTNTLEI